MVCDTRVDIISHGCCHMTVSRFHDRNGVGWFDGLACESSMNRYLPSDGSTSEASLVSNPQPVGSLKIIQCPIGLVYEPVQHIKVQKIIDKCIFHKRISAITGCQTCPPSWFLRN